MGLMPDYHIPPLVTIHPYSFEALGAFNNNAGNFPMLSAASAVYVSANLALFFPFQVFKQFTVRKFFWYNGTAVSGNVCVAVYDAHGTRLGTSGSVAQAGTSVIQEHDVTDFELPPGVFYLAIAMDNVTGTLVRSTSGGINNLKSVGVAQQASAFPLPAAATLATIANDYVPLFGLTSRAVV